MVPTRLALPRLDFWFSTWKIWYLLWFLGPPRSETLINRWPKPPGWPAHSCFSNNICCRGKQSHTKNQKHNPFDILCYPHRCCCCAFHVVDVTAISSKCSYNYRLCYRGYYLQWERVSTSALGIVPLVHFEASNFLICLVFPPKTVLLWRRIC